MLQWIVLNWVHERLTLDDKQCRRDNAGDVVAGNTLVDSFIFPAQLHHSQIASLPQRLRARREARIYLWVHKYTAYSTIFPTFEDISTVQHFQYNHRKP